MFTISDVLLTALGVAGIDPPALNAAYDRRGRVRLGPMVETDHPPRRIGVGTTWTRMP